jgi:hypothetical protein
VHYLYREVTDAPAGWNGAAVAGFPVNELMMVPIRQSKRVTQPVALFCRSQDVCIVSDAFSNNPRGLSSFIDGIRHILEGNLPI